METEDMVKKVEQALALLQEVYEACDDTLINQYGIEDHLNEAKECCENALNLLKIELI